MTLGPQQKRPLLKRQRNANPNRSSNSQVQKKQLAEKNVKGFGGLLGAQKLTTVDGIIRTMKEEKQNMINSKKKNYNGIRKDMQFNERNMKKVTMFGEMGGYWMFHGNDIHFFDVGEPKQMSNGTQLIMLHENKMEKNQHPWHTHPHPYRKRGFWPSIEDMKSILKLPLGKYHLIITIHGIWVLSNLGTNKNKNSNAFKISFEKSYENFHNYFHGNNEKRGKAMYLLNAFAHDNKISKPSIHDGAVYRFKNTDLKLIRREWRERFGIEIQFFRYKKEVVDYLKTRLR